MYQCFCILREQPVFSKCMCWLQTSYTLKDFLDKIFYGALALQGYRICTDFDYRFMVSDICKRNFGIKEFGNI